MTDSDLPTWSAHFAQELKIARERAGYLSQRELASAVGWSRSRIADIESGRILPPLEMVDALEGMIGSDGLLRRIWSLGRRGDISRWMAEYFEAEEQATHIREFQPSFPPGPLQTRDVATAILGSGRFAAGLNDQPVEERVEMRLQRQRILTGSTLESYWVIVDEAVLHRVIGSPDVMRAQLRHFLDVIERYSVNIQVLPFTAGATMAAGPMTVLDVDGHGPLVHLDGPVAGTTTSDRGMVRGCTELFDILRSQALSLDQSAKMIEAQMEEL